ALDDRRELRRDAAELGRVARARVGRDARRPASRWRALRLRDDPARRPAVAIRLAARDRPGTSARRARGALDHRTETLPCETSGDGLRLRGPDRAPDVAPVL